MRICRKGFWAAITIAFVVTFNFGTLAQEEGDLGSILKRAEIRERINSGILGIATGDGSGLYSVMGGELANVYNEHENTNQQFRILPHLSIGSVQNLVDLIYLRDTQLAFVQNDVLAFVSGGAKKVEDEDSEKLINQDIANDRIVYIAKLYEEEIHVIVRPGIESFDQINGKATVAIGHKNSGSAVTASLLFESSIDKDLPNFRYSAGQQAVNELKKGEIDAVFMVVGKSPKIFDKLNKNEGYSFVSVPIPEVLKEQGLYRDAELTSIDYPNLIEEGQTIETLSVSAVLAAYNFKREGEDTKLLRKFIDGLGSKLNILKDSANDYNKKWREVKINSTINGWNRHEYVKEKYNVR